MPTFVRATAALLLSVALAGCTKPDDRKPVFAVRGKVTYKGEPMAGAKVGFHPLSDPDPRGVHSTGTADKDGYFKLTTYVTDDGAPAGEYAVTIYWPGKRAKEKTDPTAEDDEIPPDRLNRTYADPKTTKLRATVRERSNTIDFTLP
jgi:hypothetical protein